MSSRRLFIGLMANAKAQRILSNYQMEWRWPKDARLVAPERLHLTLLFLGDVEADDESRLRHALNRVPPMAPLYLRLQGLRWMEGGVAALGVEENQGLELLQGDLHMLVQQLGLWTDPRPWQPHVSLARDATGAEGPAGAPAIEWDSLQFSLVCSRPERTGSYEVVESWPADTLENMHEQDPLPALAA